MTELEKVERLACRTTVPFFLAFEVKHTAVALRTQKLAFLGPTSSTPFPFPRLSRLLAALLLLCPAPCKLNQMHYCSFDIRSPVPRSLSPASCDDSRSLKSLELRKRCLRVQFLRIARSRCGRACCGQLLVQVPRARCLPASN